MNIEHDKIEGDIEITSELKIHGMFTGNVTVKSGGYLVLHGMATKSLIVESGAVVEKENSLENTNSNKNIAIINIEDSFKMCAGTYKQAE